MKRLVLTLFIALQVMGLYAQQNYCGMHNRKPYLKNDGLKVRSNGFLNEERTIPIMFHVVHSGEELGTGSNISDEQILSALEILNKDYNRENEDAINTREQFLDVAADMNIRFCPALIDPDGNVLETPGIRRGTYQEIIGQDQNGYYAEPPYADYDLHYILPKIIWDTEKYYNVVILDMPIARGIAHFPANANLPGIGATSEDEEFVATATTDAVSLNYLWVGSSETNPNPDADPDHGRVLTHETGHWLGLLHISGDYENCDQDDYCEDTPDVDHQSIGICPAHDDQSCGSINMWENYMDYTNGECMNMFTLDQKARIETALTNSPRRIAILQSDVCDPNALSISKVQKNNGLKIYPNPSNTGLVFVQLDKYLQQRDCRVSVFNMNGQLLQSFSSKGNEITINTVKMNNGVYIIKVCSGKYNYTAKMIVN